ncbi:MAG: class A beta-lactamase [Acidobacteriota bacterium]|nr:class A beta-lactamase [Acidobacteriota bacterium]
MTIGLAFLMAAAVGCSPEALRDTMRSLAAPAEGRVGAAGIVLETGQRASWNAAERFPMQSVYKLPIAMAVFRRVDDGRLRLDRRVRVRRSDVPPTGVHSPLRDGHPAGGFEISVRDLLRASIVDSDGLACDVLLRLVPPDAVTGFLRRIGVEGMTVATTEKAMSSGPDVQLRNWATPEAARHLLRLLHEGRGVSPGARELLLAWMTETETGPGRIRGALPPGTPVAHKTGSSGTHQGRTRATNDVGLITLPDGRHLAIAVFVSDSRADTALREGAIANIARALWDCWSSPASPAD